MGESTAAATITIMGLGGLCLAYPIGWLADKSNRYLVLMLCGVGAAIGALLLPFVLSSHLALWPVLFFWGGCFAGLYAVVLTVIGQRFRGNELVVANVAIAVVWGVDSLTGLRLPV